MKRKLLSAVLAAVLVLSLTACAQPLAESEDSYPTLPSFSQEQTPLEQLEAAISNTRSAGECTLRYGIIRKTGDETTEESFSQSLSDAGEPDWATLYSQVPDFPDNTNFISDFCSHPLRAIPSNTGTIRYQLTDLSREDMDRLLYAAPRSEEAVQAVCGAALDIDADGRLCCFELTMETEQESLTIFLSVTFPESP